MKTAPPKVAILTPSFNREDLVAETLDSILAQTMPDWENIIVDDGSTDRTKEIVASYVARDPRFKLFDRKNTPKGAGQCRNEGVAMSQAKYVMFLDTDDIIEPFCLEQRVAAMEADPTLDFAIFPSLMFEKTPGDLGLWWNVDKPQDELTRQFRQDGICQGTGVLFGKDAFERVGMWNVDLAIWQDIDLYFRAYIQGYRYAKFFDLPPDLHNRVTPTSLSRGGFLSVAKTESRAKVVRNAVELLKINGQADRVPEARFMTAELVSGATRSNQIPMARDLLAWAIKEGVVTGREARSLSTLMLLYRTPLGRLPGFKGLASSIERSFQPGSTLGCLPYPATPRLSPGLTHAQGRKTQ